MNLLYSIIPTIKIHFNDNNWSSLYLTLTPSWARFEVPERSSCSCTPCQSQSQFTSLSVHVVCVFSSQYFLPYKQSSSIQRSQRRGVNKRVKQQSSILQSDFTTWTMIMMYTLSNSYRDSEIRTEPK